MGTLQPRRTGRRPRQPGDRQAARASLGGRRRPVRGRLHRLCRRPQAQAATVVAYGDGLEVRIHAAAPDGVTAFIDLYGPEYVHLAVRLGIPPDRINTVIAFDAASELGTRAEGSAAGPSTAVLAEIAALAAGGRIQVPIAATYPRDKVQDAFAELEQRHAFGKIVLIP